MEFLHPQRRNLYLKRLSASFLHSYSGADLRQATSLPTVCISTEDAAAEKDVFKLHRQRIEAELEELTTETLASLKRRSKYQAVTIPSSVKHQVTETPSGNMARPRSPQRKNDVYLQGLLDEQLAVIRQQLNSLSSERAKMEQKMEDIVNGIKEVQEQSAHMPKHIIITSSTPGIVRRVHSMDSRKKQMVKTDSEQSLLKYKSGAYYHTQLSSSPLDEVDGESWPNHQRYASESSVGSSNVFYRDNDVVSLAGSVTSSLVSSSTINSLHPPCRLEYMDDRPTPTPIPELPESPSVSRSVTPLIHIAGSPLRRLRSSSSTTPPSALKFVSSPARYQRMNSQPSPPSYAHALLSPSGLSAGSLTPTITTTRPRSGSFSVLASPHLALKSTLSSSDLRTRSSSSPAPLKKKSPGSKLRHNKKDQQLSYFRKNSFTDLESSLKGSQTSIADDYDGCNLKGSRDNVAEFSHGVSGEQGSPPGVPGRANARILRRSSLTGQIEHVANLRAQVRRNNSFNASSVMSVEGSNHPALKQQHLLCARDPRIPLTPTPPRRIVYLKSKETTV